MKADKQVIRDKYKNYSTEELIQDEYFILSMTNPTCESDSFWRELVQEGIIAVYDYQQACYLFDSLQVCPEVLSDEEIQSLWKNVSATNDHLKVKKQKRKRRLFGWLTGSPVSALLILFICVIFTEKQTIPAIYIENIEAPAERVPDIQLVLAEDNIVTLDGQETEIIYGDEYITINNDLRIKKKIHEKNQIAYNQLIVPKGKRSTITFEDGSKIWVNVGTRIVYPVVFEEAKREIYVDGEIFLDIYSKKECPFIVKSKKLNVEVLGTQFGFMAYESDEIQHVVLVSGSVKIESKDRHTEAMLTPNNMFLFENGTSCIQEVDIADYTSWKSGMYQYHSERLDVIMKRLSRYYGIPISCEPEVAHLKCSGKLDLKGDLNAMLRGISQTVPVSYQFRNGIYVIVNK